MVVIGDRALNAAEAVIWPVPPLAMPSVPDVICEAAMAIDVSVTLVACPCALNAMTGTADALPYVDAVSPVFVMLKTVPPSVRPVPAEYVIGAPNCVKTIAVVPTTIGSGVCCTKDVLASVVPAVTRKKSPASIWSTPEPALSKSVARVRMYTAAPLPTCVTV